MPPTTSEWSAILLPTKVPLIRDFMVTLLGFHLFPDTNYKLAFCVILSTEMVQVCSWNPSLVEVKDAFILHNQFKDHFEYAPSQWETTLQCNVASHWLAAYTKWSLPIAIAMAAGDLTCRAMAPVAMLFKPLMSCTLVGNEIVDHSDSWSTACQCCSNYIFILNLLPGFNGLGKDNCKMRQETFKFEDLV